MMNTKRILVKLYPLEKFYFGGETVFHDLTNESLGRSSYIVYSRLFPQQTSLLGMLRYVLLDQEKLAEPGGIAKDKQEIAAQLIGSEGFRLDPNNLLKTGNFGKIHSICPVFIMKGEKAFTCAPLNFQSGGKRVEVSFVSGKHYNGNSIVPFLPEMINFNYKKGFDRVLISQEGDIVKMSDIFIEVSNVGIFKDRKGGSNIDAFFKQTCFRFSESDLAFAFYAYLEESCKIEESTVSLGGDGSLFRLEIDANSNPPESIVMPGNSNKPAAVCLSPAFIEKSWLKDCLYHASELIEFRFLKTSVRTEKYYNINSPDVARSAKFNLFERGSIFYFNDSEILDTFTRQVQIPAMQQIGYNYLETIK